MKVTPLAPAAGAYYSSNNRVDCIMGPVGSMKTTASCLRIARHVHEQLVSNDGTAYSRWAIVRNTKDQLQKTTMNSWRQLFPPEHYGDILKQEAMQTWNFKPANMPHPIHAEFYFAALDDADDVAKLLSLEVTGFYFNELREINDDILAHAGRRAGRYPSAAMGGTRWKGWIGDTNAWDTNHPLHEMFVLNPRPSYGYFRQPGGMHPDAENLENLEQTPETLLLEPADPVRREQGRKYYRDALIDYKPDDARVYVHNEFGRNRAGKPIYSDYSDALHCQEIELQPGLPICLGLDFGRTPAATIGQRSGRGNWRVRHELVATDMGLVKFAEVLAAFLAEKYHGWHVDFVSGDPAGNERDNDDHTAFEILKGAGIIAQPAPTNVPSIRIEAVNSAFRRLDNGAPSLIIHPDCKVLRVACIDGYHYRKLKVVGNMYDDKPNKNAFSHVAEALQYMLLGGGEGRKLIGKDRPRNAPPRPKFAVMD